MSANGRFHCVLDARQLTGHLKLWRETAAKHSGNQLPIKDCSATGHYFSGAKRSVSEFKQGD